MVRLVFEWGGRWLWCGDAARDAFGVGPVEDRLPLSAATRQRLAELCAWHDGALDWEYPTDPRPWPPEERQRFQRAAAAAVAAVRPVVAIATNRMFGDSHRTRNQKEKRP